MNNEPQEKADPGIEQPVYRIYLEDGWYIPVDEHGFCSGRYFEGALGCVIELLNDDKGEQLKAVIKIPRLRADTTQENEHVVELTAQEERTVARHIMGSEKLLPPAPLTPQQLRKRRALEGHEEAKEQLGQILLVRFEKSLDPRICGVKLGSETGEVISYPEIDVLPRAEDIRELMNAQSTARGLPKTWVCELPTEGRKDSATAYPIVDASARVDVPEPWYAFLPSITYKYANTNLQEAICEGKRGNGWGLKQHFQLIGNVLDAVDILHSKETLHADIRPANVMCIKDPTAPDDYVLGDYGSLSDRQSGAADHTGGTLMGPRIGSERHSPFYSPERRTAIEVESADTAIVWRRGVYVMILLGWNKSLISASGRPYPQKVKTLEQVDPDALAQPMEGRDLDHLQAGDRIRLRDLVFTVKRETELDGDRVLICDDVVCRVFHGHLVVPDYRGEDSSAEPRVLQIPSIIEMKKWSAATDLYGVGALGLYSCFHGSLGKGKGRTSNRAEIEFGEMIRHLESPTYFHSIWDELDTACLHLGGLADARIQAQESGSTREPRGSREDATAREVVQREVRDVVSSMTRSVPGLRRIWLSMDRNVAYFALFLHFILSCLHRESHLEVHKTLDDAERVGAERLENRVLGGGPFCKNRLDEPSPRGAAYAARERLRVIQRYVNRGVLASERAEPADIHDYQDPLDEDYKQLKDDLAKKTKALEELVAASVALNDYVIPRGWLARLRGNSQLTSDITRLQKSLVEVEDLLGKRDGKPAQTE